LAGVAIVAASLRLLFDPDFSYLLFQHGSYMAGYILLALGGLMSIVALFGLASVLIERPCLLWAVRLVAFSALSNNLNDSLTDLTFSFLIVLYSTAAVCGW